MTLKIHKDLRIWKKPDKRASEYASDQGLEYSSKDPAPNQWIRKNILDKVVYWIDTVHEPGSQEGYRTAFNELTNYAIPLGDIKLNIESYIAQTKINRKESKVEPTKDNFKYYDNELKALENVLLLVNDKIPPEERDRLFTLG